MTTEVKPTDCLECGNPDTLELNDGASGYCPKCGTAWANYIKFSFTIDSGGELVEDEACADDATSSPTES